ncbi:UNVERIFIED_CONTAM: hypothetical protein HDU68_012547 [Siphonaria sp. JEL0065]|nr:hypothetical protein HDU68_012547 [Siphonaria sp. JEL0065]
MIVVGKNVPTASVTSVQGDEIAIRSGSGIIHLQLRRFSGCPICNTHIRSYARYVQTLVELGVTPVVVFHSEADVIRENQAEAEWTKGMLFVADPERVIYKAFGADFSVWSIFSIRAITTAMTNIGKFSFKNRGIGAGVTQRPMDILIKDGIVLDFKYGVDAFDQWSGEEVVALVKKYAV